jgi:hypothetical protein
MARLLPFLLGYDPERESGVTSLVEYAEVVRRLTIPHYEEAWLFWKKAMADGFFYGAHEISQYTHYKLKRLINQYGYDAHIDE